MSVQGTKRACVSFSTISYSMKKCGLLGRKLTHSYSPMVHEAFGKGYSYEIFEVEPEDLADFMQNGDFHGINVTIPYKKDVIPFCTELSQAALAIGSVNTILRLPGGGFFGDNTDCLGFFAMLKQGGINPTGKKILVLGSGGSSLTVCHVLRQQNAGEVVVISTRGEDNYENLAKHFDAQVIINTTPVGMYPETGETLIPLQKLSQFSRLEGVLDLVYNPAKTRLIMDAEILGLPCLGGLVMLVGQAAASAAVFSDGANVEPSVEKKVQELLRRKTENLVLVGMPGCGKTTIGRLLAEKLSRVFVDSDSEIENFAGRTIPEIFAQEGEEGFRKRETTILQELGKKSGMVISTGGGCVTRDENYFHLQQNGVVVFLERDVTLLEREGRPLSRGNLQNMYEIRLPNYRRFANFTAANDDSPDVVAAKILERIWLG